MATFYTTFESSNGNYDLLEIRMYEESRNGNLMPIYSTLGSITFQRNKGELDWYGLNYVIETGRIKELIAFTKLATKINYSTNFRSQPADVIKAFKGIEIFFCDRRMFKVADKGKYAYKVYVNGHYYSDIVGRNQADAEKKLRVYIDKHTTSAVANQPFELKDELLLAD